MAIGAAGYGYGYGSGDGSGYGNCDGYGSGESYWPLVAVEVAGQRGVDAVAAGATLAFWRSGESGEPVNGGRGTRAKVGLVEEVSGPLVVCTPHALHASLEPWQFHGKRLWVVALYGEVQQSGGKMGALKREILAEVVPNPFVAKMPS